MEATIEAFEKMKSELDKYGKKLLKHENKWNVASVVQRLSSYDQSKLLKASVESRKLTVTLIPKLKEKIDSWLITKDDRLLQDIFSDYGIIENKVLMAYEEFENLETGKNKAARAYGRTHDEALSLSIEQSLKQKRENKAGLANASGLNFSYNEINTVDKVGEKRACPSKCKKEQQKGGGDVNEILEVKFKELSNSAGKSQRFLDELKKTLTPEELNWLLDSKQVLEMIRGIEDSSKSVGKSGIVEGKVKKWIKEQFQREGDTGEKRSEEKFSGFKAVAPPPIPIDTFMNFVESLPGEMREMVREQTDSLQAIGNHQMFTNKPRMSHSKGRMVNMNNLRDEYRDDRFDASNYRMRVPDEMIDDEYLKWIKEQKIDDAVERYFGTFKKRELPSLSGDLRDIVKVPGFIDRLPKTEPPPPLNEDPKELLENYNLERVNLLLKPDFDFSNTKHK